MAAPVPVADVASVVTERAWIVDLARRAAGRVLVCRRPRCERCDGWLYIDQETTTDECYEVACLRCGNRAYLDVATLMRLMQPAAVDVTLPRQRRGLKW